MTCPIVAYPLSCRDCPYCKEGLCDYPFAPFPENKMPGLDCLGEVSPLPLEKKTE